jgi:peptidoglycan/LPS O-acetylase OafA/YrhL
MAGATAQDRLGVFDLLRFIAAVMVVCLHHGTWDAMAYGSPLHVAPALGRACAYGRFGVDIFFVISGYFVFLTADGRGWKDFVVARLSRIYPALLVFCTLSFAVISLWGGLPAADTPHLRNYLGNISLASFVTAFLPGFNGAGYVEGVYWTLAYEFVWYAVVALFLVRGTVPGAQRFLGMLTAASVGLWAVLWCGADEKIGQIGQFLPYFILGAQLYLLTRHRDTIAGRVCFAANAALIAVSVYFRAVGGLVHLPHSMPCDPWIALALVASAVVVMVLAAGGRIRVGGALVGALGASTYPLYLMHDKAGVVLAEHLPWLRGLPGLLVLLLLLVSLAVLFALRVEPRLIAAMRSGLRRLLGVVPRPARPGQAAPADATAPAKTRPFQVFTVLVGCGERLRSAFGYGVERLRRMKDAP